MREATRQLSQRLTTAQRSMERIEGHRQALTQSITSQQERIADLTQLSTDLEQAQIILTSFGDEKQKNAQAMIEALVTRGLQVIFDPTLSFHLVPGQTGKTQTMSFSIRTTFSDGSTLDTPVLESRGGGLAAVVGFLVRLVVLLLSGPEQARIMVLDESFSFTSREYTPRVAEFLKEVTDKTGLQILMVTHQDEFLDVADKCYRFSLNEAGSTVVTSVR